MPNPCVLLWNKLPAERMPSLGRSGRATNGRHVKGNLLERMLGKINRNPVFVQFGMNMENPCFMLLGWVPALNRKVPELIVCSAYSGRVDWTRYYLGLVIR